MGIHTTDLVVAAAAGAVMLAAVVTGGRSDAGVVDGYSTLLTETNAIATNIKATYTGSYTALGATTAAADAKTGGLVPATIASSGINRQGWTYAVAKATVTTADDAFKITVTGPDDKVCSQYLSKVPAGTVTSIAVGATAGSTSAVALPTTLATATAACAASSNAIVITAK